MRLSYYINLRFGDCFLRNSESNPGLFARKSPTLLKNKALTQMFLLNHFKYFTLIIFTCFTYLTVCARIVKRTWARIRWRTDCFTNASIHTWAITTSTVICITINSYLLGVNCDIVIGYCNAFILINNPYNDYRL